MKHLHLFSPCDVTCTVKNIFKRSLLAELDAQTRHFSALNMENKHTVLPGHFELYSIKQKLVYISVYPPL